MQAAANRRSRPTPPPPPARPAEPRILVSLATYNERDNLGRLIAEIHKYVPHAHVLVVDDNSPDGTGQLADELAAADPRIHVLHRPGKLGLGTATLAAMQYAMDHGYDYLQNMDADFSHPPRYLPGILAGMAKHDVMIGSRYVARRRDGELAAGPAGDQPDGERAGAVPVPDAGEGRERGVPLLPGEQAAGGPAGADAVAAATRSSRRCCSAATRPGAGSASTRSSSRTAGPGQAR